MNIHLGYERPDRESKARSGTVHSRNRPYPKTVNSAYGPVDITVPKNRAGTFMPSMVPKGTRKLTNLNCMIISLYAGERRYAIRAPLGYHQWGEFVAGYHQRGH